MDTDIKKMMRQLQKYMDGDRYQHTLGVMYTSAALAMSNAYDMGNALKAGLLHDCAKCIPNEKKLKLCRQHGIPISEVERTNPYLLHAKLGVYIAREKYGVTDKDILSAIRYHTTGKPDMSTLEKIVFIADYIEPNRAKAANLPLVREIAYHNLDTCMYFILRDTLSYLETRTSQIDDTTQKAYQYYQEIYKKENVSL